MIKTRRKSRKLVVQALYQQHIAHTKLPDLIAEYYAIYDPKKVELSYFKKLVDGIHEHQTHLDKQISPLLDRPITDVNPIELIVLRMGTYELMMCIETPAKVILNEAIQLTKMFGAQDGHRYVNGILNALAHQIRPNEL